jgi:hypothetical protein
MDSTPTGACASRPWRPFGAAGPRTGNALKVLRPNLPPKAAELSRRDWPAKPRRPRPGRLKEETCSARGNSKGLSSRARRLGSSGATGLARLLFPRTLAPVTDPMSGFFAVRTAAIDPAELHPRGFKILLEVLVRTRPLRVVEVPFEFAERCVGKSKASWREMARYLRLLVALRITTARPGR